MTGVLCVYFWVRGFTIRTIVTSVIKLDILFRLFLHSFVKPLYQYS